MDFPGNHRLSKAGPVVIACMDPDARNLMERAEEGYRKHARASGKRSTVRSFIFWLFEESGFVDDVREKAVPQWREHMKGIRAMLKEHPNPTFRRSHSRGSIYGFAYWLFRWSGLVDPLGKAPSEPRS